MFEAYSVGVTLKLNNLVSAQLTILSQEFAKLDGLVIGLNKSLKAVGGETAVFKTLATGINSAGRAMERAAVSASAFQRNMAAAIATAAAGGGMAALPGAGGRGGGSGGNPRNPGNIAHGGNIHFGPGGIGIGTIGVSAGSAFVPLAVGAASIYGGHAAYEAAKDLDTERARFKLYGLGDARNADAFRFVDGMRSYGVSQAERMKLFREAQGVFRESGLSGDEALHSAKMALPGMSKLALLMSTMTDEGKAGASRNLLSALRFAEMSGGNASQSEFNRFLDIGFKLSQSSGGQVNFEGLRQFKARAGAAGFNLSADALAALEPIMGELTASTTGRGLRVSRNRLQGLIRMPNQAAHALVDSGLWDKSQVEFNSQGGIKKFGTDGPLSNANAALFDTDPAAFYTQVLRPMYERMKLDTNAISRMNSLIFGGDTGGTMIGLIEKQMTVLQKSRDALKVQIGMFEGSDMVTKTLTGQQTEFMAAWEDFKASAGTTLLPFFSGLLKMGAGLFRALNAEKDFQKDRPWYANIDDGFSGKTFRRVIGRMYEGGDSPFVAGGPGAGRGMTPAKVYMDGRLVGEIVTAHQARAASAPQTGQSGYDGRVHLRPVTGTR